MDVHRRSKLKSRVLSSSKASTAKKQRKIVEEDPEDDEIRKLEAKLGLKGSKRKRNSMLGKALARVGLPSGLESLLDEIDDMEGRIDSGASISEELVREYGKDGDSDDDRPEEVVRNPQSDVIEQEPEAESDGNDIEESDEGEDEEENEEEDVKAVTKVKTDGAEKIPPRASSQPWVPPSRRGLLKAISTGKPLDMEVPVETVEQPEISKKPQVLYGQDAVAVAPSRLAQLQELSSHPDYAKVKRRVQSAVNKLSESNLDPLSSEIVALFDTYSKALVNSVLIDVLLAVASSETQVLRPLIMVSAALVTTLHIRVDSSVSGHVLEKIIRRFMELSKLRLEDGKDADASDTVVDGDADTPETKQANNLFLFICYLCVFNMVHSDMVFDIMDMLAKRMSEWDVEVLLLALQHSGFHLRGEDPERMKSLLAKIESTQVSGSSGGAGGHKPSVRVEVMLELIQDVRNKRLRQTQQQLLDRGTALRKWLNRLAARFDQSGVDRRFRASLKDVCNVERTGRWWIVGASWIGKKMVGDDDIGGNDGKDGDDSEGDVGMKTGGGRDEAVLADGDAALMELAKQQRMNTDVKRRVFVALMGAEDPESAMDRLLKLGLRGSAEREIVKVLVDCLGQETSYNPYYADVAVKLCNFNNRFKFTFQLTLWDEVKSFAERTPRRIYNMARLLARLLLKHSLSLAVLKVMEFTSLSKHALLFLRGCLGEVLCCNNSDNVRGIFSRVGAGPDKLLVRDGLLIFLQKYLKSHAKTLSDDQKPLFLANFKIAKRALETIAKDEEEDLFGMS